MHTVSRPIAHPASFQVRRWTMPKRLAVSGQASESILDVDRIVVPVHQGMHWVCAVIDLQQRKFIYYDSLKVASSARGGVCLKQLATVPDLCACSALELQGEDHVCLEQLAHYLRDEYKNKRNQQVNSSACECCPVSLPPH